MTKQRITAYEKITNTIIENIEKGGSLPWDKKWQDNPNLSPTNLISGNAYNGINALMLDQGFDSNYWLTFNQAKSKGGTIRKGEKSTPIVFWQMLKLKDKDTGEDKTIPMLKSFNVFNITQTKDIEVPKIEDAVFLSSEERQAKAESIIKGYKDAPKIEHGKSNRAFYRSSDDLVSLPAFEMFKTSDDYYNVAFHELGHSTGHSSRLKRDLANVFGSHKYSKEELIAELTACFLCKEAGINTQIDNSSAYLNSWLKVLRADPKLLIQASGQATKATKLILGEV